MDLDLGTHDPRELSNKGAWIDIKKAGEETGISIQVVGLYADVVQAHQRKKFAEMQREKKRGKEFSLTLDELEERTAEFCAMCTLDWKGVKVKGEVVKFDAKLALELYKKHPWITSQLNTAIAEEANFLG